MRRFDLIDMRDGERVVAEGGEAVDGRCVVFWLGNTPSTVLWLSVEAFEAVSVGGADHEGKMRRRLEWTDG